MQSSAADSQFCMRHAASTLLAVVLLGAVVGKVFFLPVESRLGLLAYPGVLPGIVLLEVVGAAWFLCLASAYPSITRIGGSALFGSFAGYSMLAWLRGEPCQCFGQAVISPLVPFSIDAVAILLLWLPALHPSGSHQAREKTEAAKTAGGGGLGGLALPRLA